LEAGEIGCAVSHLLVYKKIIENNISRAVVLEDDAKANSNFIAILKALEQIKINNYLIKLDRCTSKQSGDNNRLFTRSTPWHRIRLSNNYFIKQPLNDPKLTTGYYIDIKAAHNMLVAMPKIFTPADNWEYFRFFVKLRFLNSAVVCNNNQFKSTIESARYKKTKHQKNINKSFFVKKIKKFFLLCRLTIH
jgi:glycosyl transferase family 25